MDRAILLRLFLWYTSLHGTCVRLSDHVLHLTIRHVSLDLQHYLDTVSHTALIGVGSVSHVSCGSGGTPRGMCLSLSNRRLNLIV